MNQFELVNVPSDDLRIAGYYVSASTLDPSEWTWTDRGDGPKLTAPNDGVHGPFAAKADAQAWLDNYGEDDD